MESPQSPKWQLAEVSSPNLSDPVAVVAAFDVPYVRNASRLQNLSIYLPKTEETTKLVGQLVMSLPTLGTPGRLPQWHVHVHGGAWRDYSLTSRSIEPTVAHAFSGFDETSQITAIMGINYTVSPSGVNAVVPVAYDPLVDNHSDPAREAVHPMHVLDVLNAFRLLRSLGLADDSYILSGHSCGACMAMQTILQEPRVWGLDFVTDAPRPAALIGVNGLYDLPQLICGLGPAHRHLRSDYQTFIGNAFGTDQNKWPAASPARFDADEVAIRVQNGRAPRLVYLDQSAADQLVPENQLQRLMTQLTQVENLQVLRGNRCTGSQAAVWEQGYMLWETVQDTLNRLTSSQ